MGDPTASNPPTASTPGVFQLSHDLAFPSSRLAAPEQLLGLRCTLQADIYSFGVVLAVLNTGQAPLARGELRLPTPEEAPQVRGVNGSAGGCLRLR